LTVGFEGGAGTASASAESDSSELELVPALFVALRWQVYVFPLVNPETLIGEEIPVADPVAPPSVDVQVTS